MLVAPTYFSFDPDEPWSCSPAETTARLHPSGRKGYCIFSINPSINKHLPSASDVPAPAKKTKE